MDKRSDNDRNRVVSLLGRELTVHLSITVGQIAVFGLTALLVAYILWSAYWYMDQGLYSIKWHTHIIFTGMVFAIPAIVGWAAHLLMHRRWTGRVFLAAAILALTATLLETALVVTGISKNYMERRAGHYQSPYVQNMGNYYNVRQSNDTVRLESGEFSFVRVTNSLGHSDREWKMEKDSGTLRIIALGDSFTEGDGAPTDSSYPVQLEAMLNGMGLQAEVMNAGASGSDPLFCYQNLEDRLLAYAPDIVIQTVSSDDMLYDIPLRGGMERFGPDGQLQLSSPPWWEPLVAASYVLRETFRILGLDLNRPFGAEKNPEHVRAMGELLDEVIYTQDSLGREHGFISLWLMLSMKHETRDGKHVFPFEEWVTRTRPLETSAITLLLPCYEHTMESEGNASSHYYWKIDGHHNRFGYEMMARCIAEQVIRSHQSVAASTSVKP